MLGKHDVMIIIPSLFASSIMNTRRCPALFCLARHIGLHKCIHSLSKFFIFSKTDLTNSTSSAKALVVMRIFIFLCKNWRPEQGVLKLLAVSKFCSSMQILCGPSNFLVVIDLTCWQKKESQPACK